MATLPLTFSIALHRALNTWSRIDGFVALTSFQRNLLVQAGLPDRAVFVKPNYFPGNPLPVPWSDRRDAVVFVGRLSEEKGVHLLLQAWLSMGAEAPALRIVGDGPLRGKLESLARSAGMRQVVFLGRQSSEATLIEIATAKLLVLPSICFEGFPLVLAEAFACGTPAAVSELGPLPDLVRRSNAGICFAPNDPSSLGSRVRAALSDPGLPAMGNAARAEFESRYTPEANLRHLESIYDSVRSRPTRSLD